MVEDLEVGHRVEMAVALMEFDPAVLETVHPNLNPVNMVVNGLLWWDVKKLQFAFVDRIDALIEVFVGKREQIIPGECDTGQ
jgi:hypothetical protein